MKLKQPTKLDSIHSEEDEYSDQKTSSKSQIPIQAAYSVTRKKSDVKFIQAIEEEKHEENKGADE